MVSLYEAKMQLYRQQIEELESHLSALASDHAISPQSKYNCPVWYNYMYMWSVTPNRHYTLKDWRSGQHLEQEHIHVYKNRWFEEKHVTL